MKAPRGFDNRWPYIARMGSSGKNGVIDVHRGMEAFQEVVETTVRHAKVAAKKRVTRL